MRAFHWTIVVAMALGVLAFFVAPSLGLARNWVQALTWSFNLAALVMAGGAIAISNRWLR